MVKDRYYSKEKYEAPMETFGVGIVFIIVGVISLVLNTIHFDFIGLSYWGYWLFIPAFFIMIGGFTQINTNRKFQKAVRVALMDRDFQGNHKLEDIALEVGIKPKDVLRVLVDLRDKGFVKYKFNSNTGEIELGKGVEYKVSTDFIPPPKKIEAPLPAHDKNYCVYCGQQLSESAQFCENCGSKI
ncbi:MAG: zinc-ribbon domain-containing protein [Candidatus Lokiarchaeota archaeon]|nr:zinc-ribbon domain-containing protein [Candidatus Lokiarchaeota archaeon]